MVECVVCFRPQLGLHLFPDRKALHEGRVHIIQAGARKKGLYGGVGEITGKYLLAELLKAGLIEVVAQPLIDRPTVPRVADDGRTTEARSAREMSSGSPDASSYQLVISQP